MDCRVCGVRLEGDERNCPSCFTHLEWGGGTNQNAVVATPALEPQPEAVMEAPAEPEQPAPTCATHPGERVAGTCGRCGSFICRTCHDRPDQPYARCPACAEREEAEELTGIGGWLIIPAIWCVLSPLIFAWLTATFLWFASKVDRAILLFYASLFLLMFVYWTFTSVCFFLKKRFVPPLMIGALLLQFAFGLITSMASESANTGSLVQATMLFAVWGPYFALSKRVKRTFVR